MPRLLVEPPDEPPTTVDIRDGLTAGRNADANIILLDPQASREHLRFHLGCDGDCSVTDLKSSHGTLVNGKPIQSRTLTDGDVIQVGRIRIKFIDPEEASIVARLREINPLAASPAASSEALCRLRVFYDVARAITQPEDINALLGRMLEAILDVLGCERGVIGLHDPSCPPDNIRRIIRGRGAHAPSEVIISRTLIEATMVRRQGIIANDSTRGRSLIVQDILSAMGVPLLSGSRVLGFIYVDDRGSAHRFLEKDLDFLNALAHLTAAALENAARYQWAANAIEVLRAQSPLHELIGDGPAMQRLKNETQIFARAPATHVLIQGEIGTGKELVARTLHALSPRAGIPLVTLNCAAIPETMVESELFGHAKGAFTGAFNDRRGKFVLAHEGTLFLDEIGDLSLSAQAKVLRAVQQGEVQPLGSEKTLKVNVRIIAATHKDLEAEVVAGRFRADLLYRLKVLVLKVPPLRERVEDIPRLAQAFLREAAMKMGKHLATFTPRALAALAAYRFPGNVRELQNEAERAAIIVSARLAADEPLVADIGDLNAGIAPAASPEADLPQPPRSLAVLYSELYEEHYPKLHAKEKALVQEALERCDGNITEAARLLGISRSVMRGRMKRFELLDDESD